MREHRLHFCVRNTLVIVLLASALGWGGEVELSLDSKHNDPRERIALEDSAAGWTRRLGRVASQGQPFLYRRRPQPSLRRAEGSGQRVLEIEVGPLTKQSLEVDVPASSLPTSNLGASSTSAAQMLEIEVRASIERGTRARIEFEVDLEDGSGVHRTERLGVFEVTDERSSWSSRIRVESVGRRPRLRLEVSSEAATTIRVSRVVLRPILSPRCSWHGELGEEPIFAQGSFGAARLDFPPDASPGSGPVDLRWSIESSSAPSKAPLLGEARVWPAVDGWLRSEISWGGQDLAAGVYRLRAMAGDRILERELVVVPINLRLSADRWRELLSEFGRDAFQSATAGAKQMRISFRRGLGELKLIRSGPGARWSLVPRARAPRF